MKEYKVVYYIKENNTETKHEMKMEAESGKEACTKVKEIVKEQTKRNAFRPKAEKM